MKAGRVSYAHSLYDVHPCTTAWTRLLCSFVVICFLSPCSLRLVPTGDISRHLIVEVDSGAALQV